MLECFLARRTIGLAVNKDASAGRRSLACEHFNQFAPMFEIVDAVDFVLAEAKRLRHRYPKILALTSKERSVDTGTND